MQKLSINTSTKDQILIEDFDQDLDSKFIKESLQPYFRDLFRDLSLRCMTNPNSIEKKIDKVTFIQYT
jgi:hypothetical protein